MRLEHWLLNGLTAALLLAACKKEPPPSFPPGSMGVPAPLFANASAPRPGPAPAPLPGSAALGLPCTSEQDLQCAHAHCLGNRCGGCQSSAECKPGAHCVSSWLGYVCLPGVPAAAPESPAPESPAPAVPPSAQPALAPLDAGALETLRVQCVERTNELRARATLAALTRRPEQEPCSDAQAQSDGTRGTAHGAFGRCQEGAQNECPGWPGSIEQAIDQCLAQMFAEGPGPFADHGHYLNMTDARFSGLACGFNVAADGQVWLIQNFYR